MSAWDIAGAVVWTPLAIWLWFRLAMVRDDKEASALGICLVVPVSLGAVFCIARLFGAHA